MSTLVVLTYDDQETGRQVLDELGNLQKMQLLTLEDAALAVKNDKGKVKVTQTLEKQATGTAALWGGFWGLLIGLFFVFPILWGLFGALMGGLFGKAADLGIDNKFIKEVGESLEPGGSAVFALVVEATEDKVLDDLSKYGGHVYQTSLSEEDEELLKQALEHPKLKEASDEVLDVD